VCRTCNPDDPFLMVMVGAEHRLTRLANLLRRKVALLPWRCGLCSLPALAHALVHSCATRDGRQGGAPK
jgi:hypothetical protein